MISKFLYPFFLLLSTPALAGSGAGGVHATTSSNLERFNARAETPAQPAQPVVVASPVAVEMNAIAPAAGIEEMNAQPGEDVPMIDDAEVSAYETFEPEQPNHNKQ